MLSTTAHYIAQSTATLFPLFSPSFIESEPQSDPGWENMAGYLKVLSSLSRSAAAFSRNPAVLAPAANIQSVPQRNCECRQITGVILSIIVFTVDLCFMVTGV